MTLPDYFRNQLPDPIKQISDACRIDTGPRDYTHLAEYCYPILNKHGAPSYTSLGWVVGCEPMVFEEGQQICLHGVWVEVDSFETTTNPPADGHREVTYYKVVVRLPKEAP